MPKNRCIELHEVISVVTGNQNMVVAKVNQCVGAAMILAPIDLRLLPVPHLDVTTGILDIEQSPLIPQRALGIPRLRVDDVDPRATHTHTEQA
jgi:hypothetical protein